MTSKLVDFHCHLDLYPDFEARVRECDAQGIYALAVTTTPRAWERNHELACGTRHVRAALGLHPQLVASHGDEISVFEALVGKTRYVGEVGLDAGPKHYRSLPRQREVFARVLDACARGEPKVLSIHSVRAVGEVLDMLEERLGGTRCRSVLHWFTGTRAELRRAVDLGCWFSVNAKMLEKQAASRIFAEEAPLQSVLTETDGPFTEPTDQPSPQPPSANVHRSISALAAAYGVSEEEAAGSVLANLNELTAIA